MASTTYVPILKAKEGEYGALGVLGEDVKIRVTPLMEIPGIPYDYVNDRPARTLDAHIGSVAQKIRQCWGARPIYLDFSAHAHREILEDGSHAFGTLLSNARELGVTAIPVVYTTSSELCFASAAAHARSTSTGACIRLLVTDFDEEVDLEEKLDFVLTTVGVQEGNVDILLDLQEVEQDVQRSILLVRALLGMLPRIGAWRRVILAAASFPEDLREVDAATITSMPRKEWDLWTALQRRPERLQRRDLVFADYGITHPTLKELDPRTMRMSASIRYTGRNEWVIVKGRNVRQFGFDQYYTLCDKLVEHPSYAGRAFSWGDGFIAETAGRRSGPGNATTWRKVGTNHHITLVAIQLASLTGS